MCQAMVTGTSQGDIYFGRTMDFSYPLEPEIRILFPKAINGIILQHPPDPETKPLPFPRESGETYPRNSLGRGQWKGFGAAVLYFPGCASMMTRTLRIRPGLPSQHWNSVLLGFKRVREEAAPFSAPSESLAPKTP